MELLTKKLKKLVPALYTNEQTKVKDIPIIIKFFTPDSNWSWYVTEGEVQGDDFIFFGLVDGIEKEWGYFSLKELESIRGPLGLPIERDLNFEDKKIKDIEEL